MTSPGRGTPTITTSLPEPSRDDAPADTRCLAWRPDLADAALKGRFAAQRYTTPQPRTVNAPLVPLRRAPDDAAEQVSELLFGEPVRELARADGWAWVQSGRDDYVGYCRAGVLAEAAAPATHMIAVPQASVFAAPSIKSAQRGQLFLNSRVRAGATENPAFLALADGGGFLHARYVRQLARGAAPSLAGLLQQGEMFLGTPYVWGGCSRLGIDCSGLVQTLLGAQGIAAPRDSDQQQALGTPVQPADPSAALRAGDLVFFPGHVGIMVDSAQLLHANAYWMRTLVEPLADVIARLAPDHAQPVTAIRRLDGPAG